MGYEPQKLNYSHEALADMILANPGATHKDFAKIFDRTPVWVSYVVNSDAFQAFLAKRREQIVDPGLILTVEDRLKGLAVRSCDLLMEKLEGPMGQFVKPELLTKIVETSTKALGYGQRTAQVAVNTQFVVAMPTQAPNAEAWAGKYSGGNLEAGETVTVSTTVEVPLAAEG